MKNLKAQAAMEYLMTYGWAILIVVIVAAALFALGLFNPSTFTQPTASGFQQFSVPAGGWQLSSTQLTVIVKNGVGSSINVTDAFALYGSSVSTAASVKGTNVVPSGIGVVVGANEEVTMIYTVSGPAAATAYSATANLTYTVMDTGLTFTSSGTLTGTST